MMGTRTEAYLFKWIKKNTAHIDNHTVKIAYLINKKRRERREKRERGEISYV